MTMIAPTAYRRHQERGGEGPPSSSSSLTFPLDGRRLSPLVLGFHGDGGAGAPPRLDLSLSLFPSISALPDSALLPFLKFPEIRNSDWAEIWTRFLSGYWLYCGERRAPTTLRGGHEGPGRAPASWPPWASSRVDSFSQKSHIFPKKSPSVSIPFGLRLKWIYCETKNMQQTVTGTGHWINMLVPKIV